MHVAARQAARSVTRSGARSSRWARGSLPLPRHAPARGNTHRQAAPSSASSSTAATVARRTQRIQEPAERPSTVQLRNVFIAAGLPMVGFGMMDNIVMVSAGDLIDNSIGLRFGLSTLAAAACGQVVSDVCGTVFGGWVELMAARLGLPIPDLTPRQRAMRIVRGTATAGAVLGVILGCTLGMTTLLFIDTTSKEREKKQREMDSLFKTIMDHSHEMLGAERCSLFLVDRRKGELWSKVATDNQGMLQTTKLITVPLDKGVVGEVARTGMVVNVADAYKDSRFYSGVDKAQGSLTTSILAVPVVSDTGEVVAVIEMMNKRDGLAFDDGDIKLCTMLAHHVSVFLRTVEGSSSGASDD